VTRPTSEALVKERIVNDLAEHKITLLHSHGMYRHWRCAKPGTRVLWFDIVTWPGSLCYTGDMGTFVFRRLHDMFEFFRRSETRGQFRIDLRYWAEKIEASDRCDGVREWTADKFCSEVRDFFEQHADEDWSAERKAALWNEIDEQVCAAAGDSEHHAWVALWEFEHDGFRFQDWERDCRVWTHRFLWCCHALEWAIATYDSAKQPATAEAQR
jgi:hypothetical protein